MQNVSTFPSTAGLRRGLVAVGALVVALIVATTVTLVVRHYAGTATIAASVAPASVQQHHARPAGDARLHRLIQLNGGDEAASVVGGADPRTHPN